LALKCLPLKAANRTAVGRSEARRPGSLASLLAGVVRA